MTAIRSPVDYTADLAGRPNENGSAYFGVAGQDPEINPITVYWDAALTQVATQPLTMTAGYIVHSGARAQVYTSASSWSVRTKNSAGSQVDYFATVTAPASAGDLASTASSKGAGLVGWKLSSTYDVDTTGKKLQEFPSIRDDLFGAAGTGSVDDSAAFEAAIEYGGEIWIPPGTYRIDARTTSILTRDATLRFASGANVVLNAAIGAQAFTVNGGGLYRLHIIGGSFDASAVANPGIGGDVGTVWDLNQLAAGWSVDGGYYVAGADYTAQKGDTAIDVVNCASGWINGVTVVGWYDCGIYLTGASSTGPEDDGGPVTLSNITAIKCGAGITDKRRNRNVIINNFQCQSNYVDFGSYEVGTGEIQPGDRFIISGYNSVGATKAALEIRGYGELCLSSSRIVDWGYDLAGVVVANPTAIILSGVRYSSIDDSVVLHMRDKANTANHSAISVGNLTIDATVYTATNNTFRPKVINSTYALYEGAGVGPSFFEGDCSEGVATYYSLTNASTMFCGLFGDGDWRWYVAARMLLQMEPTRLTLGVPMRLKVYTVATLPAGGAGDTAFVSDANATTFNGIVAGGGANGVPVFHDGTNWRIG